MTKARWSIRAFKPGDEPDLQAVRAAAFAPVFQSFRNIVGAKIAARALSGAEAEQEELLRGLCRESADKLFVAEMGGRIAGFVSYALDVGQTGVGEIGLNAVHPDYAGQGLGTALYEFVLARMRGAGMQVATVGTGGDPAHAPARRAYEKAGFGPYLPSIYMYKTL